MRGSRGTFGSSGNWRSIGRTTWPPSEGSYCRWSSMGSQCTFHSTDKLVGAFRCFPRSRPHVFQGFGSQTLCLGCAGQAGGSRVERGRRAAAQLPVVSHDQAVGESDLAILPVEECLLHRSLVLECQFSRL